MIVFCNSQQKKQILTLATMSSDNNIDGTGFLFSASSDSDVSMRQRLQTALSYAPKSEALDTLKELWCKLKDHRKPMHRLNRIGFRDMPITRPLLVAAVKAYHEHLFQWLTICHLVCRCMKTPKMNLGRGRLYWVFKKGVIIGGENLKLPSLPSLNRQIDKRLMKFVIRLKKKESFHSEAKLEKLVTQIAKNVWDYSPYLKSVTARPRWLLNA